MKTISSIFTKSAMYLFSIAFLLSALSLFSQNQYAVITHIDAGNPQGLNTQRDNLTAQWTSVTTGPYSTNSWSALQALPFAYEVFGQPVTQYRVSQNGLLTFNTGTLGAPPNDNTALPSALLPDLTLAVFWDAFTLNPPTTNTSNVYFRVFGSAPNRQYWVKWNNFEYSNYTWAHFAIVFEESSNKMYFVDYNYNNGGPGTATIGVQLDATTAQQAGNSPNYSLITGTRNVPDNDYFEFIPMTPPVNLPYSNDFSACTWPAGWFQNSVNVTDLWSVSNSSNAGGTPCEMRADDLPGAGVGHSRLIMVPFVTTGITALEVSFRHFFDAQGAGMTYGLASSSDLTNWTPEWTATSAGGNLGPELVTAVVNNNLGSVTYLSFFLDGNMNNHFNSWNVDDVVVQEYQPCLAIPYTQDFDASTAWPAGWSTDNPAIWSISNVWPGAAPPTGYHVYSDYNTFGTGTVFSPCFDGISNTNLHVRFYHYWRADYPFGTQDGYFYGSPDGGTTVYLIDEWHHNAPASEEGWKEYNISAWADGADNIIFAFVVTHNDDWYWVFDDFQIQEGSWGTPGLWTGVIDTDWSNPGNWSDLTVPGVSVNVNIPVGCPNYPVMDEVASVNSLYVMDGADFTITTGGDLTTTFNIVVGLNTGATFTINNGTINSVIFFVLDGSDVQMNDGSLNLQADLYVSNGNYGKFELNGGDCAITGNIYTTFGSITEVSGGTLTFNNWFRSPTQVFARGNVAISGGLITANGSVIYGAYDFNGVMNGPGIMLVGGTFRNLSTNWNFTDGLIQMKGTADPGPHYYMASLFGAGNKSAAYNLDIAGAGVEFRSNPTGSIAGLQVHRNFRVMNGHFTTLADPGYKSDDVLVGGDLIVGPLGSVTMDVSNINTITGDLTVRSYTNGTGSWIDNGNTNVSGTPSAQRYITPDQWHYISSPLSNALSGVFLGSYLREWEEPNYAWGPYIVPTNIPLNVAQGYQLWRTATPKIFSYTGGMLNTGDKAANVTATDRNNNGGIYWGDYEGWNLAGNPFPSAVDWDGTWSAANIDPTVYLWDGSIGQYAEWNWFTGLGTNKSDGIIPAGQGFFVKANNFNPALTIPQSARLHSAQTFYKTSGQSEIIAELIENDKPDVKENRSSGIIPVKVDRPGPPPAHETIVLPATAENIEKGGTFVPNHLKMIATGNGYSDETIVFFDINATETFDPMYDAFKFTGINDAPQIYSYIASEKMAMNCFPPVTGVKIVPLGFTVGADGPYTLTATTIQTFDDEYSIWLEDTGTGQLINLRSQPVYVFTSASFDQPNRFRLHFTVEDIPFREEAKSSEISGGLHVYAYGETVYVSVQGEPSGEYSIYNALGQELTSGLIRNPMTQADLNGHSGIVIVRVHSAGTTETKKLLLQ